MANEFKRFIKETSDSPHEIAEAFLNIRDVFPPKLINNKQSYVLILSYFKDIREHGVYATIKAFIK